MTTDDPMWSELFIGCSFWAFVQVARETQGWPPSEAVKQRAYSMYEAEMKNKNRASENSCGESEESACTSNQDVSL
jgi:hypothetical protein